MDIKWEHRPDCLVLRVSGDLRLSIRPDDATEVLSILSSQEAAHTTLILDMSGITKVDSTGIGALVRVPIECIRKNMDLKVVLPKGFAGEMLTQTRIFGAWPQFVDETAASKAIAAGA